MVNPLPIILAQFSDHCNRVRGIIIKTSTRGAGRRPGDSEGPSGWPIVALAQGQSCRVTPSWDYWTPILSCPSFCWRAEEFCSSSKEFCSTFMSKTSFTSPSSFTASNASICSSGHNDQHCSAGNVFIKPAEHQCC